MAILHVVRASQAAVNRYSIKPELNSSRNRPFSPYEQSQFLGRFVDPAYKERLKRHSGLDSFFPTRILFSCKLSFDITHVDASCLACLLEERDAYGFRLFVCFFLNRITGSPTGAALECAYLFINPVKGSP